jgi:hypothetical protein
MAELQGRRASSDAGTGGTALVVRAGDGCLHRQDRRLVPVRIDPKALHDALMRRTSIAVGATHV